MNAVTYSEQAREAIGKDAEEEIVELDETMRIVPNRKMRRDAMRGSGDYKPLRSRVRRRVHRIRRQKSS